MFNISKLVNKITERGSGSSGSGGGGGGVGGESLGSSGSMTFVNTEEQHSEGFLCPQCMRAFPSSEELEAHYNASHIPSDEGKTIVDSEQDNNTNGGGEEELLRMQMEQIQNLQLCLAEEKMTSDELKNEVVKLQLGYQQSGDSQGKQFENDKALLNSEVALLRKQLTDSLEQISTARKEKEAIVLKIQDLQSENVSLKRSVDSLEGQLTHKNSIDDAAVLKQELVSVQRMMDKLSLEKEKQIEELNTKIQILQQSDSSSNLELKLTKTEKDLNLMTSTVETQKLEIDKLKSDQQVEIRQSSEKLVEISSQLYDANNRKSDLENQCSNLNDELKRLNEQHTELYRKFEGGEGATAALSASQKENELLKENVVLLNQKISELSTVLQKQEKTIDFEKTNFQSKIASINNELSTAKASCDDWNRKNLELTTQVMELNQNLESKKNEFNSKVDSLTLTCKELEAALTKSDNAIKEKEESIMHLRTECDRVSGEFQRKVSELADTQEKYESQIAAAQSTCQSLLDSKQNQDQQIRQLNKEKEGILKRIEEESNNVQTLRISQDNLKQDLEQKSKAYDAMLKSLEDVKQANRDLEENLCNAEIRNSEIQETFKAQIADLDGQLKVERETYHTKIVELEKIITTTNTEANNARENFQKILQEDKGVKERLVLMESQIDKTNTKLKESESQQQLLQVQTDSALKDKTELEKRLRASEEEKTLLLEKCLSSESEFEQLQQKINGMQRKLDDSYAALQELGRENQSLQMESAKLQGRKWADDSIVASCQTCGKDFSLTIRKHHCRHCGNIFCGDCSSRTAAVPSCKKPARVCDPCYQELLTK